jgi:D-xylose 1-dehydrogenase (NADP+, D-xylono-1,5-lactone-forming)
MRVRWGILGVANINSRLLPGFGKAKNAELRAIASRSLDKAKAAAKAASIPVAHGSYEALLDDPGIDAVYIPLPNHLHAEWSRKAADRGKHVLCEKPLTPSAAESRHLVDYCRAKGVRLMDGFMWPHHPRTHQLKKFLSEGGIGRVIHIHSAFTFPLDLDPQNIRLRAESAGGSLLDVGCYPVFGIRWAFEAEPVSGWATATMRDGVDLRLNAILKFSEGRTATFDCGFTLPFRGWMEIAGTEGIVRVPEMWLPSDPAIYQVERERGKVETVSVAGHDQIVRMIEDFGNAIIEKREAAPSPEEAVKTNMVMDALLKSVKEGREIQM